MECICAVLFVCLCLACAPEQPRAVDNSTVEDKIEVQAQPDQPADNSSKSENITVSKGIKGFAEGTPAPDFRLNSATGEAVSLGKLRGNKVLLNFWATWCIPCKREMPGLEYFYRQNTRKDLMIYTICSDSSSLSINTFIQDAALTLPVLMDKDGKVRRLYSNQKNTLLILPTTFLIDGQGIIVKILRHQFGGPEDIEDHLKAAGF